MSKTYPKSTIEAAAFIKRNWKGCKTWKKDGLLSFVQWFANHSRMLAIREGGRIKSVLLFRLVDKADDVTESDFGDTGGALCYISLCVSKGKKFLDAMYPMLWYAGLNKCQNVCWAREKNNLRSKTMSVAQFGRRFGYG